MDKKEQWENSFSGFHKDAPAFLRNESAKMKNQVAAIKAKEGKPNIEYYKKSVYGKDNNYYHDPEIGKHMEALTGQKTLNENHIPHLEALGHKVIHRPKF